ncbi:MAG: hypothetical protein QOD77_1040 [Thermoplasmata archaeon]|jgi:uncharacterized phage infection (PIP) family protein YhgE|nr:hypothetical protein [Thermoplasmata archaeon]
MDLRQIKGIGPAKQQKLRDAGIASVEQLARIDVLAVSSQTGIAEASLREYRQRAAALALVEDVKGFGAASVPALAEEAYKNLREATQAGLDRLATELGLLQKKIAELQEQAKKAAQELAEEAKTSQGRARIASAAREMATEYGQKAQDATKEALAKAQEQSRIVLERAPRVVEEVRLVAEKAQARVQSEADKVKARVQGGSNGRAK